MEEKSKSAVGKEIYWVIGSMAVLVLIFVVVSLVLQSFNKFEYEGLTFTKERFGEIPVYHYYYYLENHITGSVIAKYNLYLRIDPRKNDVPVDGEIEFIHGEYTFVSIDGEGLTECEENSVAIASLSGFLNDNDLRPKGAVPDKELARELKVKYATCEEHSEGVVIMVQEGNETKITRNGESCYVMEIANCEMIKAVEKFELQTLLDARKRAGI